MTFHPDFFEGFHFALLVYQSMGVRVDVGAIARHLAGLAEGDLTLMQSPEDVIAGMERDAGRPMPESLKALTRRALNDRSESVARNRARAAHVLGQMGYRPDEEAPPA